MGLKMRSHPGDWAGLCPQSVPRPQQLLWGLAAHRSRALAPVLGSWFLTGFGFSALEHQVGPTSRVPVNPQGLSVKMTPAPPSCPMGPDWLCGLTGPLG